MESIKSIVVCGAGTMGAGIAQVAAQSGFQTVLFDLQTAALNKAHTQIEANWKKALNKGLIQQQALTDAAERLIYTNDLNGCKADVVIEAIIEKFEAKISLFHQLADINGENCIYASNTSSISIDKLATVFPFPQQFVGLHFFNPAPLMKLVEIVKGQHTISSTVDQMVELTKQMKKIPVVCADAPGFIVNRVARHYYLETMYMVEQGLIDHKEADTILENVGFKMGPFALMDLIGMDINYGVSNIVWESLGKPDRLKPSTLQKEKVEAGNLGRKTGKGFYEYPS